jgi:hypothetical protein
MAAPSSADLRYIASELVDPLAGVIAVTRQSRHARVPDLIVDLSIPSNPAVRAKESSILRSAKLAAMHA